jgi:hypothetical protein
MIINKVAENTYDDLLSQSKKENFSIDPLTILILVNVILTIVRFLLENYITDKDLIRSLQQAKDKRTLRPTIRWSIYYQCLKECKRPLLALKMQNSMIKNILKLSDEEKSLLVQESL